MTDDEISKVSRDAFTYGTGFMRDGKHVPLEDVYMTVEDVVTDDLVKRLLDSAQAWDSQGECGLATLEREAAYCIKDQQKRIEQLEAALRLGVDMREKQKAYFKRRFQDVLLDCKKAERDFDVSALAALGEKKDG